LVDEPTTHIEWQPRVAELERLRSLRDDPGRIVLLVSAGLLLLGAFLPWAEGLGPVGEPVAYTAQQAFAEGFILMVVAFILAAMAGTRLLVESTSRTVQLAPLALAFIGVAMWFGANRESLIYIHDWTIGGGEGHQTMWGPVTGVAIALIAVGVIWLDFTRPANIKAATRGLRAEWRVSRMGALEFTVAAVLAVVGAVLAGGATMAAVGPNGAFFAIFTSLLGMAVGISIGLGLIRWIRGGSDTSPTDIPTKPGQSKVTLTKVERKR
jgi:hypothetical protein